MVVRLAITLASKELLRQKNPNYLWTILSLYAASRWINSSEKIFKIPILSQIYKFSFKWNINLKHENLLNQNFILNLKIFEFNLLSKN